MSPTEDEGTSSSDRAEDEQLWAMDDADVREIEDDLAPPRDDVVWPCCKHCYSGARPCSSSISTHRLRCECQSMSVFDGTTNVRKV